MTHSTPHAEKSTRTISFTGGRSGAGALTWGQLDTWDIMEFLGDESHRVNVNFYEDVPEGVPTSVVLIALERLLIQHDSLRTMFFTAPSGMPGQRVEGEGQIAVDVYRTEQVDAHAINAFNAKLAGRPFRPDDPQVRIALLEDGAGPRTLVICLSHLLADGRAVEVVRRDLRVLLSSPDAALAHPGVQPLEQLAFEESPRGSLLNQRSLNHWRDTLARFPDVMFPQLADNESSPRFRAARYQSTAMRTAADLLAHRYQVGVNSVAMAALSLVLASLAQSDRCAFHLISANRLRPGTEDSVGQFSHHVPVVVDVSHDSFGELVLNTHKTLLLACRYAMCSPIDANALIRQANQHRGGVEPPRCVINPMLGQNAQPPLVTPEELMEQSRSSRFSWDGGVDRERISAYVQLGPRDQIVFFGDTRSFPPHAIRTALESVERVLISAVIEPNARPVVPDAAPA
jgi:hypothetical protein